MVCAFADKMRKVVKKEIPLRTDHMNKKFYKAMYVSTV